MRRKHKEAIEKISGSLAAIGHEMYNEPTDDKDEERLYMLRGAQLQDVADMIQGLVRVWIENDK